MGRHLNNLEQLLATLNDGERAVLATIKLTSSERTYLKNALSVIQNPNDEKKKTPKKISDTHAYKIRSVVANAIVTNLAGDDELHKLSFLRNKRLRSQFIRHLAVVEKKIGPTLCGEQKEYFYQRLFQLSLPWDSESVNEALIKKYITKYADARVVALPHEEEFFEATLLFYAIASSDSQPNEQTVILRKLKLVYSKLHHSSHTQARFMMLRGLFECYVKYNHSIDLAFNINAEMLLLATTHPERYTARHEWLIRLEQARLFVLQGKNEEAYTMYQRGYVDLAKNYVLHGIHEIVYFQTCLYTGHINEAKEMIDQQKHNKGLLASIHKSDVLTCSIMFDLLSDNIQEALKKINNTLQCDHDLTISFYHRLLFRGFEVACHIFLGDYQYAEALIRRHIKFSEYNAKKVPTAIVPRFLRLANAIIAEHQGIKKLQPHHLKKIDTLKTDPETEEGYCLYLLLEQMRKKTSATQAR